MAEITEKRDSNVGAVDGVNTKTTFGYCVELTDGIETRNTAIQLAWNTAPATTDVVIDGVGTTITLDQRRMSNCRPLNREHTSWDIDIELYNVEGQTVRTPPLAEQLCDTSDFLFEIDITGSQGTIQHSYAAKVATLSDTGTADITDFANGILIADKERVIGAPKIAAAPVYRETHCKPAGFVTPAYFATLSTIVGRVNSSVFRSQAAKTALLLGVTGTKTSLSGPWILTYAFSIQPNVSRTFELVDNEGNTGSATLDVDGHDYVNLFTIQVDGAFTSAIGNRPVTRLTHSVEVHKIYEEANFGGLGI